MPAHRRHAFPEPTPTAMALPVHRQSARRWAWASAWLVVGLCLLLAWPGASRAQDKAQNPPAATPLRPLTIAVSRTNLSLPLYVARAQGLFADEGLEVAWLPCMGGPRCLDEMLAGRADLATFSEMVGALQALKRPDFAVLTTLVSSSQDIKLVTRRSSGLDSWAKLSGKRIGTVRGTSAHYYLDAAMLFHGVDARAIQRVDLPPEALREALRTGEVDAVAVWEPLAHEAALALAGDVQMLPAAKLYSTTFNLHALKSTVRQRPGDIDKVLRALDKATQLIQAQPALAQQILKLQLGVDQSFIDTTWRHYDYRLSLSQSLVSTMEGQMRWAMRNDLVPPGTRLPNLLQVIDTAPLQRVSPRAVTLVR